MTREVREGVPASRPAGRRARWDADDVPGQSGRTAVVTGSGSGVGLETARVLAGKGATVVLACRDMGKAERSADRIRAGGDAGAERGLVRVVRLDLASLASVREAASEICSTCPRLDLLINNAGVMEVPCQRTEDGFELTFGTNHLGHFALTGLLLERLLATPGSRVVTVSSLGHTGGVMHFDDLHFDRQYNASQAYWQSKLANLLFSYELQSRLKAAGARTIALAAHPGIVRTDLWRTSSALERALISPWLRMLNFWAVQTPQRGALPTLRAAADPSAQGGEYYGPSGPRGYAGYPVRVASSARSHDVTAQRQLWQISEQLTGVSYRVPAPPSADPGSASSSGLPS